MNIETVLGEVRGVGSLWWLPVLIWVSYFFWSRFLDYPAVLEKFIKSNKTWPYLPMYWKGNKRKAIRFVSILLFWLGNLYFGCVLYNLFPYSELLLVIGTALSAFVEHKIRFYATKEIVSLQQDRHYQIYIHLKNQALLKGDEILDNELFSKAQWQHHNDLRLADKQGRFMEFLKGEAKL